MYSTAYEVAVNALGTDGLWREWSEPLRVTTLAFSSAASAASVDPACAGSPFHRPFHSPFHSPTHSPFHCPFHPFHRPTFPRLSAPC